MYILKGEYQRLHRHMKVHVDMKLDKQATTFVRCFQTCNKNTWKVISCIKTMKKKLQSIRKVFSVFMKY